MDVKYGYELVLRSQLFEYLRETWCRRNALERLEAARLVFILMYDNLLKVYISVQTGKNTRFWYSDITPVTTAFGIRSVLLSFYVIHVRGIIEYVSDIQQY